MLNVSIFKTLVRLPRSQAMEVISAGPIMGMTPQSLCVRRHSG